MAFPEGADVEQPELEPAEEQAQAPVPQQEDFDRQVLIQTLAQARSELAMAKAALHCSRAGVAGLKHHNELLKDLRNHAKAAEVLERLLTEGMPMPDAVVIELADHLPDAPNPA